MKIMLFLLLHSSPFKFNACFRLIIVFLCTTNNARHDYRVFLSMTCSLFCSIRLQRNAAPMCSPTHKHTESEVLRELESAKEAEVHSHKCECVCTWAFKCCACVAAAAAQLPWDHQRCQSGELHLPFQLRCCCCSCCACLSCQQVFRCCPVFSYHSQTEAIDLVRKLARGAQLLLQSQIRQGPQQIAAGGSLLCTKGRSR